MQSPLRGLKSLLHDAVELTVDLVEEGHGSVARNAARIVRLLSPDPAAARLVDDVRRLTSAPVLATIRVVNRLVERLGDAGLDAAAAARLLPELSAAAAAVPMRSDVTRSGPWLADAALGALNGAVGDYLHRAGNGLDLGLALRHGDRYLDLDDSEGLRAVVPRSKAATNPLAIFVHGLATTEWSWCWDAAAYHGDAAANFGTLLQRDLDVIPIFVRYNTGRRIAENGLLLANALERLVAAQATPPPLLLIGHSMGGLVLRSACQQGERAGHGWVRAVSRVICLGSPHQGAPLEKLGHALTAALAAVDHPGTRIPAALLRRRSAGIRDLRHGDIEAEGAGGWPAEERRGQSLINVPHHFVSATITHDSAHPIGHLIGDVLVRVPSASGPYTSTGTLRINTACFGGVYHHQIQNHPDVYAWLLRTCASAP